jgi:citrate lyase subunit gamma (acyl carrier protein)
LKGVGGMKIVKDALSGTLESSDVQVKVSPAAEGRLEVVIHSAVMRQFGVQIEKVVRETLAALGVSAGLVVVEDKGALDCAIRARVQAAVLRGAGTTDIDWSLVP